jgi:nicotinamidase-related amidase
LIDPNKPNDSLLQMHPTAPLIRRQGEVDAWDSPEFRAAVRATGKRQIILAGIVTEVCTSFLALSLREEGYEVFANTDASGTFSDKLAADANRRMEAAGVHLMGMFGLAMDLMRDWRNVPGAAEVLPFLDV